jgi:hypothetical protein
MSARDTEKLAVLVAAEFKTPSATETGSPDSFSACASND